MPPAQHVLLFVVFILSVYKISHIIALIFVPIERMFYDNLKHNVAFSDYLKFLMADSGRS